MKNKIKHLLVALALPALSTLDSPFSTAFAQGSLTPPGAPAPTMMTLTQIEPRTPISSLPYTITQPGSYYVTTNLTGATAGIIIAANDVTLDLMGFTLFGMAGSSEGILVPNTQTNLVIRNGVLASWGSEGVSVDTSGYNCQFERLRVSNCGNTGFGGGINIDGNYCTVKDCTANCNVGGGIVVGQNCTVKDCMANNDGDVGIEAGNNNLIAGNTCNGSDYGIQIDGYKNRIDGNNVGYNTDYGIYPLGFDFGNIIIRNSAPGNGVAGYANYSGNNDYGPTNLPPSTATSPGANF
jgi:hypothetical protein